MKSKVVALIICCILALYNLSGAAQEVNLKNKITLSVLFYPYVPDYNHIISVIKQEFEKNNPEIELLPSKQNYEYYNKGGLDAKYDIYELDTVFLADFVSSGRIQSLNTEMIKARGDVLKFAKKASSWDSIPYGIPHWTCALFLFYFDHDKNVKNAKNLSDLESGIGIMHEKGRGLLIDMAGHYTLGELYADCMLDQGLTIHEVLENIESGSLYQPAVDAMTKLLYLSDVGLSRSELAHNVWPPYFTHEFAHARGRALIGYSESLFYILSEIKQPTDFTPTIDPQRIRAKLLNQGKASASSLAWVDSFVIDKSLRGRRLDAAYKFLEFVTSDKAYVSALFPPASPSQYLLPAYRKTFTVPEIINKAPLYPDFLSCLGNVKSFSTPSLGDKLRKYGEMLDKKLPKHLIRPQ